MRLGIECEYGSGYSGGLGEGEISRRGAEGGGGSYSYSYSYSKRWGGVWGLGVWR
jgi:hypothetical protein